MEVIELTQEFKGTNQMVISIVTSNNPLITINNYNNINCDVTLNETELFKLKSIQCNELLPIQLFFFIWKVLNENNYNSIIDQLCSSSNYSLDQLVLLPKENSSTTNNIENTNVDID